MDRLRLLVFAGSLLAVALGRADADDRLPAPTGEEIADIVGVKLVWWDVRLPKDFAPGDAVRVVFYAANVRNPDSVTSGLDQVPSSGTVRVFCWEDKAVHKTAICVQVRDAGGLSTRTTSRFDQNYFKNSGMSGPYPGSLVAAGDPLITFTPANVTVKLEVIRHP